MAKRAKIIITVTLLFLSLLLSAYSNSNRELAMVGNKSVLTVTAPISKGFVFIKKSFVGYLDNYLNLFNVQEENIKLKDQVKYLQSENARFRENEVENRRLHQILKFVAINQTPGQVASVIGYSNKSQQQTITIDRGSEDGVVLRQIAVDGVALVGQVITVNPHSAKILLISDPLSGVDSLSQDSRIRGVVQGSKEDLLFWNYIPKEDQVLIGSRIITSGADGIFPKGLSVGVVIQATIGKSNMFQDVYIKPATNLNRIETVYLLSLTQDAS